MTIPIRLRSADVRDLPRIYEAELSYICAVEPKAEAAWRQATSLHLAQWAENFGRFVIAQKDDDFVGYAFWQIEQGQPTLASIHVEIAMRRRGVGRLLLGAICDGVRSQGFDALRLTVLPENRPACRLYESFGFVPLEGDARHRHWALRL